MKSAEVVSHLMKVCEKEGKMTSPCAGDSGVEKRNGRKIEWFTFGIARYLDGVVEVYHSGFIVLKWQSGRYPKNKSFKNVQAVEDWLKSAEWAN